MSVQNLTSRGQFMITDSSDRRSKHADLSLSSSVRNRVIENTLLDPFADVGEDQFTSIQPSTKAPDYVHIRIQQRNGKKTLTTIQGLPSEYDPRKLLKAFKRDFACNGTLVTDEELGQVIQLQGDQRTKVLSLLVDAGIRRQSACALIYINLHINLIDLFSNSTNMYSHL